MPYAPGISYDASPLAAGIASLGASVGQGIRDRRQQNLLAKFREEEKQKEEKARADKYSGLQKYAVASGLLSKDASTAMSLEELEGQLKGEVLRREMQAQADKVAAGQAEAEQTRGFLSKFAKQMQPDPLLGQIAEATGNPAIARPDALRAFAAAAGEYPGASLKDFAPAANALKAFAPAEAPEDFVPKGGTVEVDGVKIPYAGTSRGSAQYFPELVPGNAKYTRTPRQMTPGERNRILIERRKVKQELVSKLMPPSEEERVALEEQLAEYDRMLGGTKDVGVETPAAKGGGGGISFDDFSAWRRR